MIQVLRVDDRLLHGQVAVAWTNYYHTDTILIANNQLITDSTMQMAFKLAAPPEVVLSMKSLDGAVAVIQNPKHKDRKIMVIVKDMRDAEYVCAKTDSAIGDILIGGLRSGEGKKQIDMNSYMDAEDVACMDRLEQTGVSVVMQADPTSRRLTSGEIHKNFNR